jgi:hypothetical protein
LKADEVFDRIEGRHFVTAEQQLPLQERAVERALA